MDKKSRYGDVATKLEDVEFREAVAVGRELRELDKRRVAIVEKSGWKARFFAMMDIRGDDDCWEWTGASQKSGHGHFSIHHTGDSKPHRIAYRLAFGDIPSTLCVCHACDNPPCCNPRHLWLGTKAENNRDSQSKGRGVRHGPTTTKRARGIANAKSKMTPEIVRQIILSDKNQLELSKQFGVTQTTIRNVRSGLNWGHITGLKYDPTYDGRHRGEGNSSAKLRNEDIRVIRASEEATLVLARRYGMGHAAISRIRNRVTWSHVQ